MVLLLLPPCLGYVKCARHHGCLDVAVAVAVTAGDGDGLGEAAAAPS